MTDRRFVFYDYETTGLDPALDRPVQFAATVAGPDLAPLEDIEFKARLAGDVIPGPYATLVHGLTPQQLDTEGLPENEFAQRVLDVLGHGHQIVMGYNTAGFDDPFTQHLMWRNFQSPYGWQFENQSLRYDLLPIVRAAYVLAHDALVWPELDGAVSMKLDQLAPANGISHSNAHDALADTQATRALAAIVRTQAPTLWDACIAQADKKNVLSLLADAQSGVGVLLHIDGSFGRERGYAGLIYPLGASASNPNEWYCIDLGMDLSALETLDAEALRAALFTPRAERAADHPQVGLRRLRINRACALFPLEWLKDNPTALLLTGIDRGALMAQRARIRARDAAHWWTLAEAVFQHDLKPSTWADAQLYDGFVGRMDEAKMRQVRTASSDDLVSTPPEFEDARLRAMLPLYIARNFPDKLGPGDYKRWTRYRSQRWQLEGTRAMTVHSYQAQMQELAAQALAPEKMALLEQLEQWVLKHSPY
ncbi:exodeoxyribonuclease I [Litorivicinus lipolyticus]|uniref:Exodeoxyribonuclease I n=1 Tax=Litorivicinus lipolyticus TaxID=418701 RepID=A0A5Q2QF54_9GAMM|nr:exodeoxyribonuclease I [Litorivicinus lipolyticus]QGG79645.1 exodeoxyribonuclease I [Litorivicinus lipolyticus]